MTDLKAELLEVALEAAARAGTFLCDGRPADLGVAATKTSAVDVVTEMDIASEKLITGFLAERRPDDGVLGEEGASTEGSSGITWVIDPIDGTVNYLYGRPEWSVSIAARQGDETLVGVVAAPLRGETYRAVLGQGAFVNDRPARARVAPPSSRRSSARDSAISPPAEPTRPMSYGSWCPMCATSGVVVRPPSTCVTSPSDASTRTTSEA